MFNKTIKIKTALSFVFTLVLALFFVTISFSQNENFTMTQVACDLSQPWDVTYGPDDYLWVMESKSYELIRINPTNGNQQTVLDASGMKNFTMYNNSNSPQGGFTGLALHPDLLTGKPYVYLGYVYEFESCVNNFENCVYKTKVVRYDYNASNNSLSNELILCDTIPGSTDHNGGRMTIGEINGSPFLFFAVGDMGAGQFTNALRPNHAQESEFYEGKILRFNLEPDGDSGSFDRWIPNNNPYNASTQSAVWSIGHRNPQGLAYGDNGILYSAEHGAFTDDELNIIESGKNYGHPLIGGFASDGNYNNSKLGTGGALPFIFSEQNNATNIGSTYRDPIASFFPASQTQVNEYWLNEVNGTQPFPFYYFSWEGIAHSGCEFYGSSAIPGWENSILLASLKRSTVYRVKLSSDGQSVVGDEIKYFEGLGRFRDIAISPDGTKIFVACDSTGLTSGPTAGTTIVPPNKGCILQFEYQPTTTGCPPSLAGFTALGEYNNSKYFISNNSAKPIEAQQTAESFNGNLAVINDQAENDFIQQNISEMVYIGLNDAQSEGNFDWVNGDPFTFDNIDPCSFCNENSADLDYVIMAPWDGKWSFSSQWNSRKYIVEVPCGTTSSMITLNCPSDVEFSTDPNTGLANINFTDAAGSTDCPNGGLSISSIGGVTSGSDVGVGVYSVSYEATDGCGNTANCSFDVTVVAGTGGTPDLTLSNLSGLPTSTEAGNQINLTFDLNNIGTAAVSGDFVIAAYLSTDPLFGGGDTYLADISKSNTPIGTESNIPFSFTVPNLPDGDYYFIIVADVNGDVQELVPNNNSITTPIEIGTSTGGGCPPDIAGFTVLGEFGNSKYFISNEASKPADAQLVAEQNGGYLVSINDQAENDFIQQNISEMVYIGLNDVQSEGNLEWLNGDVLTYDNVNPCGFCSENSSSLDYVIIAPWDGTWSFSSQWNSRKYIVEIPCGNTTNNPTCSNPNFVGFEKIYNDISDATVTEVIQADDNGYVVLGTTGNNAFLLKTNEEGNVQWQQTYNDGNPDQTLKLLKAENGYLLWMNSEVNGTDYSTLIETNNQGVQINSSISSTHQSLGSYTELSDGGYILLERPEDENDINGVCMRRIDANGNDVSFVCMTGLESGENTNIVVNKVIEPTDDGNFLLIGGWSTGFGPYGSIRTAKVTPDGTVLWVNEQVYFAYRHYYIVDSEKRDNGEIVLMGNIDQLINGGNTEFIYHLNQSGEIIFEKNITSSPFLPRVWKEIAFDTNEDILIAGDFCGQVHPFNNPAQCIEIRKAEKYTTTGDKIWDKNYLGYSGGSSSIKNTSDGGFILSGHFNNQVYLIKMDPEGSSCTDLLPDLVIEDVELDVNPSTFSDFMLTHQNKNIGTQNSTRVSRLAAFLSTDDELDIDDIFLGDWPFVSALLVNESVTNVIGFDFPNVPDGDYFIISKIDSQNLVEESDEANNTFVLPHTIGSTSSCPDDIAGFQYLGEYDGHQYFLSDENERPTDAQQIAEQNGGYLTVINDQAENDFLQQNISEMTYIGLNDTQTEGTPQWVAGTSSYTNFDICSFCNENTNDLDYVVMHNWNGGWSWSSMWNQRKYIIEIPCPNPLITPPISNTLLVFPSDKEANLKLEAIMPNPADATIFVSLFSPIEDKVELRIFDARGVLVKSDKVELHGGDNTVDVSIRDLPGGFYFLKIPQAQVNHSTMRFVKVRK